MSNAFFNEWRMKLPRSTMQRSLLVFDALIIPFLLWIAFSLRLKTAYQIPPEQWVLFIAAPLISIPVFIRLGLYRAVIRYLGQKALWTIVQSVTLTTLLWAVLAVIATHYTGMPRSVLPIFWALNVLTIGSVRLIIRHVYLRPTKGTGRAIIWGAGSAGVQLAGALRYGRELVAVAFIDDDSTLHGQEIAGLRVFSPDAISQLIDQYAVADLLLAIPSADQQNRKRILRFLEPLPLHVRVLPGVNELIAGRVNIDDLREANVGDLLTREQVEPVTELLQQNVRDKVVLVTGAGGSIGSEICRQIMQLKPQRLVMLDHSEHALYSVHQSLPPVHEVDVVALLGSVQDATLMRSVMLDYGVHTVYHTAAYKHVPIVEDNPIAGIKNNVFGTLAAAEAALSAHIETFVLISTDKAVRPTNIMGASKRVAELLVQAIQDDARNQGIVKTRFETVRFGNVLESSGSVVPLFRQQIAEGGPVTVTHPAVTRFLMSIPEASGLVIQAGALGAGGDTFVLDMGAPIKINNLARSMIKLAGHTVKDDDNPQGDIEIKYVGLRPGEKLHEELFITGNATATRHPKILRSEETSVKWTWLRPKLDSLREAVEKLDRQQIEATLHALIEGQPPTKPLGDYGADVVPLRDWPSSA
jgi:FlaA1/EpsC-like NDP-sugar epimerase